MGDQVNRESGDQGKKGAQANAVLPRSPESQTTRPPESGGPKGKEPTRYGDWEINGKCVDF